MILLFVASIIVVRIVVRVYILFHGLTGDNVQTISTKNETISSFWKPWKNHRSKQDKANDRAMYDSYDFFNAIPNDEWRRMKLETMTIIDSQKGVMDRTGYLLSESGANINSNLWWIDNWEVSIIALYLLAIYIYLLCYDDLY